MPLVVNLRHLASQNVQLKGELQVGELDLDARDEMIRAGAPLSHDLEVQKLDQSLLVRGRLRLPLECRCVRCLKPFTLVLELADWICHLPLQGEESVAVVNDCVDLTPFIREDILLEFPRHPLCKPQCRGWQETYATRAKKGATEQPKAGSSAWAELDKLKF